MNQKQFETLKPGMTLEWSNGARCIVVDPRITRTNEGEKEGQILRLQFEGGGCTEVLNQWEGTGFNWKSAHILDTAPKSKKLDTYRRPVKLPLPAEYIFEPGNGTRFDIFMTELANGMLLVAIPNFKAAYWFNTQVSDGYVAEKLGLSHGDDSAIADLINVQLGCTPSPEICPHGLWTMQPMRYDGSSSWAYCATHPNKQEVYPFQYPDIAQIACDCLNGDPGTAITKEWVAGLCAWDKADCETMPAPDTTPAARNCCTNFGPDRKEVTRE